MTEQLAKRILQLPDEDSISSSDKYDYEYLCDAPDLKSLATQFLELKQAAREVCERVVDIGGPEEGLFFAAANELEKLLEAND